MTPNSSSSNHSKASLQMSLKQDLIPLFTPLSVSIRTYLEHSQRTTQGPKRDPSGTEGTARTPQATDQRLAIRSQTSNTA
jgi:hypothetical protein